MEKESFHSRLHFPGPSYRSIPVLYGIIHGLVDLTTVSSVFQISRGFHGFDILTPFFIILGYDLMAFGLQAPLGAVTDRYNLTRPLLVVSLVLVILGAISVSGGWITIACAGLGNALFHLSAGARVLSLSGGRAGPAGIFVAPGALGLGLGTWLSKTSLPIPPLAILIGIALIIILYIHLTEYDTRNLPEVSLFHPPVSPGNSRSAYLLFIGALLFSSRPLLSGLLSGLADAGNVLGANT